MRITLSEFRYSADVDRSAPVGASAVSAVPAKAAIGSAIGLAGGLALSVPVVLYDWVSSTHSVWELPMAATSWVFGMSHFTPNGFQGWSVLIGVLLLAAFSIACGAVFEFLADRVMHLRAKVDVVAAGLGFGFAAWLFFWYTLLPIAHGGAPFHATATTLALPTLTVAVSVTVAPIWVFVLGFALLGLTTSFAYTSLRRT
jgi:hypothetical protein